MVTIIARKVKTIPKTNASHTLPQSGTTSILGRTGFRINGKYLYFAHKKPVIARSKRGMTFNKYAIKSGKSSGNDKLF
jgi:hypothetical protein